VPHHRQTISTSIGATLISQNARMARPTNDSFFQPANEGTPEGQGKANQSSTMRRIRDLQGTENMSIGALRSSLI